jgi:hypothetical protein
VVLKKSIVLIIPPDQRLPKIGILPTLRTSILEVHGKIVFQLFLQENEISLPPKACENLTS